MGRVRVLARRTPAGRERYVDFLRALAISLVVLGHWTVTVVAGAGRREPSEIRTVVGFATIPLWFLSAYIAVVALTPVMYRLHRRFGFAVPLALVVLVAAGDTGRLLGSGPLSGGNFLLGWLAIHQIGFAWYDSYAAERNIRSAARVATALSAGPNRVFARY